jgi:L-rhamnose mutarotase
MQRMAMMIGLRPEAADEYRRLHEAVWPSVLIRLGDCGIRNYSVFLREPENILVGFWEYHGDDFARDMADMAADPETQRWWALTAPCQTPLETCEPVEWWAPMTEMFHIP